MDKNIRVLFAGIVAIAMALVTFLTPLGGQAGGRAGFPLWIVGIMLAVVGVFCIVLWARQRGKSS